MMSIDFVMAGLGPAIHVLIDDSKTWMPGTRPGMTPPSALAELFHPRGK
jgi:hypothetical protein